MKIVILCGGSGTRLWPLSTDEKPKQFLKLTIIENFENVGSLIPQDILAL